MYQGGSISALVVVPVADRPWYGALFSVGYCALFSVGSKGDRVIEVVGTTVSVVGDAVVACGTCHTTGGDLPLLFAAAAVLTIIIFNNARTRLIV